MRIHDKNVDLGEENELMMMILMMFCQVEVDVDAAEKLMVGR